MPAASTMLIGSEATYRRATSVFSNGSRLVFAHSAHAAIELLETLRPQRILIALQFEDLDESELLGDIGAIADRLYDGDRRRAVDYLRNQQGTLIVGELRGAGCTADLVLLGRVSEQRLARLRDRFGNVSACDWEALPELVR